MIKHYLISKPAEPLFTLSEASGLNLSHITIKNKCHDKPAANLGLMKASVSLKNPLSFKSPKLRLEIFLGNLGGGRLQVLERDLFFTREVADFSFNEEMGAGGVRICTSPTFPRDELYFLCFVSSF